MFHDEPQRPLIDDGSERDAGDAHSAEVEQKSWDSCHRNKDDDQPAGWLTRRRDGGDVADPHDELSGRLVESAAVVAEMIAVAP